MLFDAQAVVHRRMGPLIAIEAIAHAAVHADGHRSFGRGEVYPVAIDEMTSILHVAPETDGKERAGPGAPSRVHRLHRARDRQKRTAVWQLRELGVDHARIAKNIVDDPPGASAAEPAELKTAAG